VSKQSLIYLATPYTHDDHIVRTIRADTAAYVGAMLKKQGLHIFAPIPHGHAMQKHGLPTEYQYWRDYCQNMLDRCDILYVTQMTGWEISIGIADEIQYMQEIGKPVKYLCPSCQTTFEKPYQKECPACGE
jgi:nucleoside 2-deoxyribosyltransferase